MARKIRDGALFIILNAILMLQCRGYFNINEWLETRIFFVAFAAGLLWFAAQTYLTEKVNNKESNKCPYSNCGYGKCEMFPDFECPIYGKNTEKCRHLNHK